jgi:hypothetical protein
MSHLQTQPLQCLVNHCQRFKKMFRTCPEAGAFIGKLEIGGSSTCTTRPQLPASHIPPHCPGLPTGVWSNWGDLFFFFSTLFSKRSCSELRHMVLFFSEKEWELTLRHYRCFISKTQQIFIQFYYVIYLYDE